MDVGFAGLRTTIIDVVVKAANLKSCFKVEETGREIVVLTNGMNTAEFILNRQISVFFRLPYSGRRY